MGTPNAAKRRTFPQAIRKAVRQFVTDGSLTSAAALSFYLALALAPLALITISVVSLIWSQPEIHQQLIIQAQRFVGVKGAKTITSLLEAADHSGPGTASLLAGLLAGVLGLTGAFLHLQQGLDSIWNVTPAGQSWADWARDRLISLGIVLVIGLLMVASLLLTAGLAASNLRLQSRVPGIVWVWQSLEFLGSLGIMTLMFACLYKFLPHIQISWSQVWIGAFVTALLFNIGKSLAGVFVGCNGLGSAPDTAGTIIVVLLWEYYSSLVILFGAEVTHAYQPLASAAGAVGSRGVAS